MRRKSIGIFTMLAAAILSLQMSLFLPQVFASESVSREKEILDQMTLEEKICQMIIPAVRSWDGADLTDLLYEQGFGLSYEAGILPVSE